jgi:hypothetical protein
MTEEFANPIQECYAWQIMVFEFILNRRQAMRAWRWAALALAVLALAGCASQTNQLQLGMSRAQVVEAMGSPSSTSEMGNTVYLKYRLHSDWIFSERYYVRLVDGKVDAYGRVGDFNLGY